MKTLMHLLGTVLIVLSLTACKSGEQMAYFKDLSADSTTRIVPVASSEPLIIRPGDELQIDVTSISPETSVYFNNISVAGTAAQNNVTNLYLVSPEGRIALPLIGSMTVRDKTVETIRKEILDSVSQYLKEPVVKVRLTNFKVTVIGEVKQAVVVPVKGDRINVIEALAASGDLTVYANRHNVKVMRERDGQLEVGNINLNDSRVMQSPFYYLQQNDVVYVEPSKKKGVLSENLNIWVPVVASLSSLLIILVTNL